MKRRDRRNEWDTRVMVAAPGFEARVKVNGQLGTVEDPGFTHSTVRLDSGEVVKVPHAEVEEVK